MPFSSKAIVPSSLRSILGIATFFFLFDVEKGYNSCSYLARIAQTSDDMTEKEKNEEIERAIDEIIKYDFMNIYTKAVRKATKQEETEQTTNT